MAVKIQLNIGGKIKSFSATPKKAIVIREAAELSEGFGADLKVEEIDSIAKFISKVFDEQFSPGEVLNGLYSDELAPKFYEIVNALLGKVSEKMSQIPNA